jgi:hypothetical protein
MKLNLQPKIPLPSKGKRGLNSIYNRKSLSQVKERGDETQFTTEKPSAK